MKPAFSHDLINSFFLWFDNFLLKKVEAYKTYTTKFYHYQDDRLGDGKVTYGSPYKQFVYDQSVTGVTIPSGVTVGGTFLSTGTSGMQFDFDNGRVIFDSGVNTGLDISGTYTVKEINSYITDQNEEKLIIENKYITNSRFTVTENYVKPYTPATPSVFISMEDIDNQPFAFGGEDLTTCHVKAVAFCENLYQLDGVLSTFSDSFNEVIGKIPINCHPIAEFGSIKTGVYPTGYDYKNVVEECGPEKFYINSVETSKIRDNNLKELNPDLNIGFIEFEVRTNRYPRL
jgi:hypothetical protein